MALKVSQIRKVNSSGTYLTPISYSRTIVITKGIDRPFHELAIAPAGGGTFSSSNTYYIRFAIKRIVLGEIDRVNTTETLNISLILYKDDGSSTGGDHMKGTFQTVEQLITVEPYVEGRNTPYKTFEVVFTPNSTYSYFTLQLNKIAYDYKADTGSRADTFIIPDGCVDFDEQGDVCTINNIFDNITATKIGVQSRPGTLLCINREAIRIGRSGTYEINNGYKINFVGIAAPNEEIPDFLLDYAWEEE